MSQKFTLKSKTIINFTIVCYFVILYWVDKYKINVVIVGVFRELLTIPFLIAQLLCSFLSIKTIVSKKSLTILFIISTLALLISTAITFQSFFN